MTIGNYSVAMNAQYFNLEFDSISAKVSHSDEEFTNDTSSEVKEVSLNAVNVDSVDSRLSKELASGILKNIYNESQKLVGDRLEISTIHAEAQSLNFSVAAVIQADGKELELSLDVSLSRSFVQKTTISMNLNQSQLMDPLLISLDGGMPTLSEKTFSFDLDSDGKSDQISQLNAGNGFLALDKNSNGFIDDGSELFGAKSGDGFADLSKYDDDKNGWIDENDAIFDKLRIWNKSEGKDELIALGEVGIGAIFLGNTSTPFSLKSQSNQLLGEIRKSSFVLFENGRAGVISQVDLALSEETKDGVNKLIDLQENFSSLNLRDLYRNESQESSESSDDKIQALQSKIKELEGKLSKADEKAKPSIQSEIGGVYAQIMSLLEAEIS